VEKAITTVAWDGLTLAGDRLISHGSTPMRCVSPKVRRMVAPNGRIALFGFAGAESYKAGYLAWMRGGEEPKHEKDDGHWSILLVDDTGCVHLRGRSGNFWYVLGRRVNWAIGSGGDYALGAMAAGADAKSAVRLATGLDTSTGMGVDVVRF